MIKHLVIATTLCLTACSSPGAADGPGALADLADWRSERISLPPEFAPSLPAGEELLLFAPGMFEPGAQGYWSYVFVMRLEQAELDASGLHELLASYYDGLIRSVARSKGRILQGDPVSVSVSAGATGEFTARINLIDSFATMLPLDLNLSIQSEPAGLGAILLHAQASPKPEGHDIWTHLAAASSSLKL